MNYLAFRALAAVGPEGFRVRVRPHFKKAMTVVGLTD